MKPRLFPPGCVGIVVNSLARLLTRLARRKNPSVSSGTLWIGIGITRANPALIACPAASGVSGSGSKNRSAEDESNHFMQTDSGLSPSDELPLLLTIKSESKRNLIAGVMSNRYLYADLPDGAEMNWDIVEGNWKQFKGKIKEEWGKLNDNHLDKIAGVRDQVAGRKQETNGLDRVEADKKVKADERADKDDLH